MTFDFNTVFDEMLATAEESLNSKSAKAASRAKELLTIHQQKLKLLAEWRVVDKLTQVEFQLELDYEIRKFSAELLNAQVAGHAGSHKTAQAVKEIFTRAVGKGNY